MKRESLLSAMVLATSLLVIASLHGGRVRAAGVESCGTPQDSTLTTSSSSSIEVFHPYRTGAKGVDLTARDIEHQWDSQYGSGLSSDVRGTLNHFTLALLDLGLSPIAMNARNLQVVYDYLRRQGSDWNPTNPLDSLAMRIGASYGGEISGSSTFTNEDRSHADGYIAHPSRTGFGGQYPSPFTTLNEDVSSGRAHGDYRASNSLMVRGPATAAAIDLAGSGWTSPTGLRRLNWNHELAHSLPGAANSGINSELWSAGAEAIGGIFDTTATAEVPYHWPLLSFGGNPFGGCGTSGFSNRWAGSNYQGRTAFMAYLAYNFLNADTARTLAGMRDDLMYRWRRAANNSVSGLEAFLTDDNCATCAGKSYFRTATGPLTARTRLGVLHHNWRVANFVNSFALADSQYGYPEWSGFSTGRNQRAWQAIDGCSSTDIVAIAPSLQLSLAQVARETTLAGVRSFRGAEMPLAIAPFAANYWVIRAGSDLASASRTLVVRVTPTACYACDRNFGLSDKDGQIFANLIGYDRADMGGEEPDLWRFPASALIATALDSSATDTLGSRSITLTLPDFGTTYKSVLLTLSVGPGKLISVGQTGDVGYEEAFPYRLDVRVLPSNVSHSPAAAIAAHVGAADLHPAWSWDANELAYSTVDASFSPLPKIYRRAPGSSSHSLVATGLTGFSQFGPDWSPRRDLIVFEAATGAESGLWLKSMTTSASAYNVATPSGRAMMPAFQPDGQGLAYLHIPTGESIAYLRWVGLDGTGGRIIDTLGVLDGATPKPRWSPDGLRVLIAIPSKSDRVHWAWRWGSELTPESTLPMPVRSFDFSPGRGRVLVGTTTPIPNRSAEASIGSVFYCAGSNTAERLALLDTTTAARDTFYRAQDLTYAQRHTAWSKNGQYYAFEQRHRITNEVDVWMERLSYDHPPSLAAIADQTGATATALNFALSASDPDGEPVSFLHSTLPAGAAINNGQFTWSEPAAGVHHAIIRATDPSGDVDTRVVRITIQSSPPPCAPFCGGGGEWDPLGRRGGSGAHTMLPSMQDLSDRNTFLDGVEAGAFTRQIASLPDLTPDAAGEQYTVRLTTSAGGGAFIDALRLHVVDCAEGVRVVASQDGLLIGPSEPPTEVVNAEGQSLGSVLASEDGLLLSAGEALEFHWPHSSGTSGVAVDCERAVASADVGVAVQVLDGDTWRTARRIHPRRKLDSFGVSGLTGGRVRLVADQPVRLRGVDRIMMDDASGASASHVLTATQVDGGGDPTSLSGEDGAGLTLTREGPAGIRFAAPPAPPGTRRNFFLEVAGSYSNSAVGGTGRQGSEAQPELPREFALGPALPNPSSGRVTFAVDLPRASDLRLDVLDTQGRIVHTIARESRAAGRYRISWNGLGNGDRRVASGLYYARLRASEFTATRTIVLIP